MHARKISPNELPVATGIYLVAAVVCSVGTPDWNYETTTLKKVDGAIGGCDLYLYMLCNGVSHRPFPTTSDHDHKSPWRKGSDAF